MDSFVLEIAPIFDWLTKTTLHASVIVLIVIAVRYLLSKRLAPRWHYYLWLLVIARMLMPVAPQSALSIFNLIGAVTEQTTPVEPEPVVAQVPQTTPEVAAYETNYKPQPPVETIAATEQATAPPLPIEPIAAAVNPVQPETIDYIALLPLVWLVGVIVLAVYVLLGNLRLSRIVTQQRPVTDSDILNLLEDCKSQMNMHTYLTVVETSKVSSPALFGFIRPRLLLPEGLLEKLTPAQLRHVFLHELAHLKRGDIYFGWLVALLQTIHWFNPMIWLAFHKMRADRELACDQLALTAIQNEEPNEYGKTIVSLLENFSTPSYNPGLAGILEDRSQLKRRITMIAKHKKGSYRFSTLAAIVIAILCAVALTSAKDTTPLDEKKAMANAFADLLIKGQFKETTQNFDKTMKKALRPKKLAKAWNETTANAGPFEKKLGTRSDKYLWSDIIYVTCQFQEGPLDIKVVYDKHKKISGLWLVPVPQKVLDKYSEELETVKPSSGTTANGPDLNNSDSQENVYVVKAGDTLSGIASKIYGDANMYREILKANNLNDQSGISVGMKIKIPDNKKQNTSGEKLTVYPTEKKNLTKVASIYDKMKPAQACEIMLNLSKNNQVDYVEKIIYYMTERTSANLLAEITKYEPSLAATISKKLIQIEEKQNESSAVKEHISTVSSPRVIKGWESLNHEKLIGTWQGTGNDKPEDGSSQHTLQLQLSKNNNKLSGNIKGDFVKDNYCELRDIQVNSEAISFEIDHSNENLKMKVFLKLIDGKLQGEGIPINFIDDRCDIVLEKVATGVGKTANGLTVELLGVYDFRHPDQLHR